MPVTSQTATIIQKQMTILNLTFTDTTDENMAKAVDRVRKGRALLIITKTYLSESRNLKSELKTGITLAVDRLYQLLKYEAADSESPIKKFINREEKKEVNVDEGSRKEAHWDRR